MWLWFLTLMVSGLACYAIGAFFGWRSARRKFGKLAILSIKDRGKSLVFVCEDYRAVTRRLRQYVCSQWDDWAMDKPFPTGPDAGPLAIDEYFESVNGSWKATASCMIWNREWP